MRLCGMRFCSMKGQDSTGQVENEIHFQEHEGVSGLTISWPNRTFVLFPAPQREAVGSQS